MEFEKRDGSLVRAFRGQAAHAPRSADGAFRSLPGGLSELVRALVAALPQSAIRLNAPVTAFDRAPDGRFHVEAPGTPALDARAVVFSTPAYVTGALVRSLDAGLAGRCEDVPYASTGTIAFGFARDQVAHPLTGSGFVVPRAEGTGILAASWLSSKWPHRAPEGRVLMRTFVGGGRDPEALLRSDAELVERSLAALRPLLGIRGAPVLTRVYRFERASAQHEVGHAARLAAIERDLAGQPGVFVTGSGFRGVGIPDCVADARATAARVAEFLTHDDQRRTR